MVKEMTAEYEYNPDPEIKEQIENFTNIMHQAESETSVYKEIAPRVLFDLGATYQWHNLTLDIDVKNIFNKQYYQSGVSTGLIPQRGRWFMVSLGYKF